MNALAFATPSTFLATHMYRPSSSFFTLSMMRTPSSQRVIPATKRSQSCFALKFCNRVRCAKCQNASQIFFCGRVLRLPGLCFSSTSFLYHVISGRGTPRAGHSSFRVLLLFTSWFVKFWVSQGHFRATVKHTNANFAPVILL